jgi:hypothetical protein
MESFSTNGATVLTIAILWCVVTWMGTYSYLKTKHSQQICRLEYTIEFLDEYIKAIEEKYENVIDAYNDHMQENVHRCGDIWVDYTLTEQGRWAVDGGNHVN